MRKPAGSAADPPRWRRGSAPLDGILVPTFGAYDLAVTLLFPFVAIRLVAAEKASGAWKLLLQSPASAGAMLLAKGLTLLAGWFIAWLPGLAALVLWKLYGGTLYAPEVLNLLLGHLLRLVLAAGIAVAAAALSPTERPLPPSRRWGSRWAHGHWNSWRQGAGARCKRSRRTLRPPPCDSSSRDSSGWRTVLVTVAIGVAGFALAAVWLHEGRTIRARSIASVGILLVVRAQRRGRRASAYRLGPEREPAQFVLRSPMRPRSPRIRQPLRVTVFLSAEDPRLMDLDRNILAKLARILPDVEIVHAAHSRSGLFEGSGRPLRRGLVRIGRAQI